MAEFDPKRTSALVRPLRPDDEVLVRAFFTKVTPEDVRLRFFEPAREFSHQFIARLTQLDYARAITLVALDPASGDCLAQCDSMLTPISTAANTPSRYAPTSRPAAWAGP
jgi:hypothetical protein